MKQIELAGGLITNNSGGLLLIHRVNPSQWELPGGKIKAGETAEEAVVRELAEELGVVAVTGATLGDTKFSENGIDFHYTWIAAKITDRKPWPQEKLHDECDYFRPRSISRMDNLSLNMQKLCKQIIDGEVRLT